MVVLRMYQPAKTYATGWIALLFIALVFIFLFLAHRGLDSRSLAQRHWVQAVGPRGICNDRLCGPAGVRPGARPAAPQAPAPGDCACSHSRGPAQGGRSASKADFGSGLLCAPLTCCIANSTSRYQACAGRFFGSSCMGWQVGRGFWPAALGGCAGRMRSLLGAARVPLAGFLPANEWVPPAGRAGGRRA